MIARFRPKFKLKKDDNVIVISGNDKGKTGKIMSVDYEKSRVVVEGIRLVSKHTKPNAQNPDGGIIKKEAAIHISNVALVDPKDGKATKVGRVIQEGKLVRVAKNSNTIIK